MTNQSKEHKTKCSCPKPEEMGSVFWQHCRHTCKEIVSIKRLCEGNWQHLILLFFIDPCSPNIKWCNNEQCAVPYSGLPCINFMMCIGYLSNDRTTTFLCGAALNQHFKLSGNNSKLWNNKVYLYHAPTSIQWMEKHAPFLKLFFGSNFIVLKAGGFFVLFSGIQKATLLLYSNSTLKTWRLEGRKATCKFNSKSKELCAAKDTLK